MLDAIHIKYLFITKCAQPFKNGSTSWYDPHLCFETTAVEPAIRTLSWIL